MTLYSWFRDAVKQDAPVKDNSVKTTLNQAMWPIAQVRESLLASAITPDEVANKQQPKHSINTTDGLAVEEVNPQHKLQY
ncbi:hypothetical protein DXX93_12850 [Thalassotalea euphylliae]|uniref:Uncharacterized protein n=1 Tax=Thalassotalea euphylliae TaxID=1655234 RepID=A0A3E0TRW3_9GAMM|nr:hypothetical protein [Thalassotalea euphylliae]REL27366.1 hypothetical protein DXX93_12850 [Thalassotalea euphylliae]